MTAGDCTLIPRHLFGHNFLFLGLVNFVKATLLFSSDTCLDTPSFPWSGHFLWQLGTALFPRHLFGHNFLFLGWSLFVTAGDCTFPRHLFGHNFLFLGWSLFVTAGDCTFPQTPIWTQLSVPGVVTFCDSWVVLLLAHLPHTWTQIYESLYPFSVATPKNMNLLARPGVHIRINCTSVRLHVHSQKKPLCNLFEWTKNKITCFNLHFSQFSSCGWTRKSIILGTNLVMVKTYRWSRWCLLYGIV